MWLAWCAWGVLGSIFIFEDTQGGTGWLAWTMTAPFWVMFALWPLLWFWLSRRRDADLVEIDDDILAEDIRCRLVQKSQIRYMEVDALKNVFGLTSNAPHVKLTGGDEDFVALEDIRPLASDNKRLATWLNQVDSIEKPACYF